MICPNCKSGNRDGAKFCNDCGEPLPAGGSGGAQQAPRKEDSALPEVSLPAGMEIGTWIVDRRVGHGRIATIFLAHHKTLGQAAALKALSPALAADAEFRTRFQNNARIQARLQHPNIARILDMVELDGQFYIVTEFLGGGTVGELVNRQNGSLKISLALAIGREALAGVEYAHEQDVFHGHLTCSNVLLDQRGVAKVTDFGLAAAETSQRDDIFAMGGVLFEMLTGQAALEQPVPLWPGTINREIPPEVETAVMRALGVDTGGRFESCAEFAKALGEAGKDAKAEKPAREELKKKPAELEHVVPSGGEVFASIAATVVFGVVFALLYLVAKTAADFVAAKVLGAMGSTALLMPALFLQTSPDGALRSSLDQSTRIWYAEMFSFCAAAKLGSVGANSASCGVCSWLHVEPSQAKGRKMLCFLLLAAVLVAFPAITDWQHTEIIKRVVALAMAGSSLRD